MLGWSNQIEENVLYLGCSGGCTGVYIGQNSNKKLKMGAPFCM